MTSDRKAGPTWIWPAAALGVYGLLYFALIYAPGVPRMDDFGYLQSVMETYARGHLHTHDWLEPYTATLSALGAASYALTGNFALSTWGLQAVFVLANLLLVYHLLRTALQPKTSACLAVVLCSIPQYWFKCSEFSGNSFTLTFVLAALLAYRRGRWWIFFPAVFLAFANRQNSIALLALPAFHLVLDRGMPARTKWKLAVGFLVFGSAALTLHAHLNHTIAQTVGIYSGYGLYKASMTLKSFLVGACAALSMLSAFSLLLGSDPAAGLRKNLRRPILPLLSSAILILVPIVWQMPLVSFLTPMIGSLDRLFILQYLSILAVCILLWTLDWSLLRFDAPACMAASYIAISCLKGYWFDFYLVDVALATLFYLLTRGREFSPGKTAWVLAGCLMCGNILWGYGNRVLCDKQRLYARVYEGMERRGEVKAEDMTDASFGFLGWKLFDHFWPMKHTSEQQNFLCYVRREKVVMETQVPWRHAFKRRGIPPEWILEEGTARIGFFDVRYRVADLHNPAEDPLCLWKYLPLSQEGYRPRPFPLDEGEWEALIESMPRNAR